MMVLLQMYSKNTTTAPPASPVLQLSCINCTDFYDLTSWNSSRKSGMWWLSSGVTQEEMFAETNFETWWICPPYVRLVIWSYFPYANRTGSHLFSRECSWYFQCTPQPRPRFLFNHQCIVQEMSLLVCIFVFRYPITNLSSGFYFPGFGGAQTRVQSLSMQI